MYSIEQIEAIWSKIKPLYFKIVSGASKGGLSKFDGQREKGEDAAAASDDLLQEFRECVGMLNDGTFTVVMRSSESAARNEKIYTFRVGDGSTAVGNTEGSQSKQQNTVYGGGNNMNMMLFQMMMQQQQQNTQLIMSMLSKNQETEKKVWEKDMELFKLAQGKTTSDKVFGLLEKPHIAGMVAKMLSPQPMQAVGRAEAPEAPANIVPSAEQMEKAKKLQRLLERIKAQYPNEDPIDTLENGFEMVTAFMAKNTDGL